MSYFPEYWIDKFILSITILGLPLEAHMVKNLPAMQETWAWSLGWEDPLKMETATHSSILAWEILWTGVPGGPQILFQDDFM